MKNILILASIATLAACAAPKSEDAAAQEATEANVTVQEPEAAATTEVEVVTEPVSK
jgi:uncharacterized lipoprotein YajG